MNCPNVVGSHLGFHLGGSHDLANIDNLYRDGFRLFQVFLTSPKTLRNPNIEYLKLLSEKLPKDIEVIVHGPFVISTCRRPINRLWQATLLHYVNLAKLLHFVRSDKIVTHIGGIEVDSNLSEGYKSLYLFCLKWLKLTEGLDVTLCLENDPGSSTGRKIGSCNVLYKLVKSINNPRIRIAYDVEHAYANGFDISNLTNVKKILDYAGVVHLNAIPSYVERGKHLDRHRDVLIMDSKNGPKEIVDIFRESYNRNIPMILERGEGYWQKDYEYLNNNLNSILNCKDVSFEEV